MNIIFATIRMIGLGLGLGTAMKTGIDFSSFDPSIYFPQPQIPEFKIPEIKIPEIKIPDINVQSNTSGNTGAAIIIAAIIMAAGAMGTALIITKSVGALVTNLFTSLGNKLKQLWPWRNDQEIEAEVDPFEGYDLDTQLTGIPIGSFNVLSAGKVIGIWQVMSGDGTPLGVWLIENVVQHAEEDLGSYTRFLKGVKYKDLEKEFAEWLQLHKDFEDTAAEKTQTIVVENFESLIEMSESSFEDEEIHFSLNQEINPAMLKRG